MTGDPLSDAERAELQTLRAAAEARRERKRAYMRTYMRRRREQAREGRS